MRRDYYRGSQDSLTVKGKTIHLMTLFNLFNIFHIYIHTYFFVYFRYQFCGIQLLLLLIFSIFIINQYQHQTIVDNNFLKTFLLLLLLDKSWFYHSKSIPQSHRMIILVLVQLRSDVVALIKCFLRKVGEGTHLTSHKIKLFFLTKTANYNFIPLTWTRAQLTTTNSKLIEGFSH